MSKSYEFTDLRFAGFVVPPSETFADTMRLEYGWTTPGPEMQRAVPYLAVSDGAEAHIDAMQAFVTKTVEYFGLDAQSQPTINEVQAYVADYDNQVGVGVYTFLDEVAMVAHRYLIGEGDDYRLLGELADRDRHRILV
ncbi:MAG: hypothetical protein KIH63_001595 [Candidatus Saccharibacteria bacterium]|nr:hypothetical protein [Candidatus Saccharibacteria bacterium]